VAVECASPWPFAAGVSAAVTALSDDMGFAPRLLSAMHNWNRLGYTPAENA
jgi:hypothetical protein